MLWKYTSIVSVLVVAYFACFVVLYFKVDESFQPSIATGFSTLVNGSGATFPAPQYYAWIDNFKSRLKARFTYDAVASGQGKTEFFAGQSLWGGSDSDVSASTLAYFLPDSSGNSPSDFNLTQYVNPLAPEHLGTLMIPSLTGGLAIVYNTPDIKGQLVFDGDVLGRIFCGNITWWNDTALAALNPGIAFPQELISVAARDDSSGTTQLFTTCLSNLSPTFKFAVGVSSQPKWPSSFVKRDSAIALAFVVETLKNSISYAPTDTLVGDKKRFSVASVVNKDGIPVLPTRENIVSAMMSLNTSVAQKRNYFSILNQPGASSYPLATFTYVLLREHYYYFNSSENCDRVKAMVEFWRFCWDSGLGQQLAATAGWIPLSGGVLNLALKTLDSITCNRIPVTDWFDTESRKDQFFGSHLSWYQSINFWNRVNNEFQQSKFSASIYVIYFFLLLVVATILFRQRFSNLNLKEEKDDRGDLEGAGGDHVKLESEEDSKPRQGLRFNLDNLLTLLGVAIGFQQYLSQMILKSKVISSEPSILSIIENTGLFFYSSLGYLITLKVFVLLFNIGMIYILFVFPYLLEHHPLKVVRLSSLHAILQIFLPNFAIIFYTPAVEMLAGTLSCKFDGAGGSYISTYGYSCWTGYHWLLVGFSIILSACFVWLIIFYSHVFKTLRKYCDLKDSTWLPVIESFVKFLTIFSFINLPNAYFLAAVCAVTGGMSMSFVFYRPSELALLILEVTTDDNDYRRRQDVSNSLVVALPAISFAFIGLFFVFSYTRFEKIRSSTADKEDFEKFVQAFSEEVQMSMVDIRRDSASKFESTPYIHSTTAVPQHPMVFTEDDLSSRSPSRRDITTSEPSLSSGDPGISRRGTSDFPWEHLSQLARKAKLARIISEAQSEGLQLAARHKDEVVATLFRSANGNFKEFIGIMGCTQWQLMAMRRASAAAAPSAGKGGSRRGSKVEGVKSAAGSNSGLPGYGQGRSKTGL
ncbi:Phosphate-binding protein PstS 1 [Phlyctochytrium planicorne]|nr:Phosphate-binding protein PstS 1 [Phlyctochytrium planicorne]